MRRPYLPIWGLLLAAGCAGGTMGGGDTEESTNAATPGQSTLDETRLTATIGPAGGELVGRPGTAFADVRLTIPPGALARETEIAIEPARDALPLPETAVRCGPMFTLSPVGLLLKAPATLTLPFDQERVADQYRFEDEVKVWVAESGRWDQELQLDGDPGRVTIELDTLTMVTPGVNPLEENQIIRFPLKPNPPFYTCLAATPNDTRRGPEVQVTVVRGDQNDRLFLRGRHIKPGLAFTLFLVEHSELAADGSLDPAFTNFGLASYKGTFESSKAGDVSAAIRGVILDQNFAFDPSRGLDPTTTFQVGFWFDDPEAAEDCGFDPDKPTPFNEEHEAGPNAMISLPDGESGLGPLCTNPDTSVSPARCNP